MSVDREVVARYLRQLAELGVDELVLESLSGSQAVDILAGRAAPPPARLTARTDPPDRGADAVPGAFSGSAAAAAAAETGAVRAAAAAAATGVQDAGAGRGSGLALLQQTAAGCTLCRLHETRTTVVFGEGDPSADVVVVGEAPGQEEDRTGRPFVGRAGRLLDLLLQTAGFPRQKVYICNVLKCRPPSNRNPMADEVSSCTTAFLHAQLDAIQPKVLLAVGKFAAQALLASEESIGRLRGTRHTYRGTPLVVTYHPAYLLRSPQMTRVAWQDFQLLRKVLHEQA